MWMSLVQISVLILIGCIAFYPPNLRYFTCAKHPPCLVVVTMTSNNIGKARATACGLS